MQSGKLINALAAAAMALVFSTLTTGPSLAQSEPPPILHCPAMAGVANQLRIPKDDIVAVLILTKDEILACNSGNTKGRKIAGACKIGDRDCSLENNLGSEQNKYIDFTWGLLQGQDPSGSCTVDETCGWSGRIGTGPFGGGTTSIAGDPAAFVPTATNWYCYIVNVGGTNYKICSPAQ
jgi:hypothetical protein